MIFVLSGFSAPAREKEAAGGLLLSAAGPRDTGKEVCHHPEGADPAGTTSGGDKVGGKGGAACCECPCVTVVRDPTTCL